MKLLLSVSLLILFIISFLYFKKNEKTEHFHSIEKITHETGTLKDNNHMYNPNSSEAIRKLMQEHKVICTEWFYHFIGEERPDYTFIQQVDGYKENAQTLEMIGSSWIDWRDWSDTTLNELPDTLITDAKLK